MINKSLIAAFCGMALLVSCNNNAGDNNNNENTAQDVPNLNTSQQEQLAIFNHYIELKDALIEAKVPQAASAASDMNAAVSKATAPADSTWHIEQALMAAELLKLSNSKDIDSMRAYFSTVSDRYYSAISKYGLYTKRAYRQFCPMYGDDKGGYWLSTSDKIQNPYYGHDMLECGEVTDTLQSR